MIKTVKLIPTQDFALKNSKCTHIVSSHHSPIQFVLFFLFFQQNVLKIRINLKLRIIYEENYVVKKANKKILVNRNFEFILKIIFYVLMFNYSQFLLFL